MATKIGPTVNNSADFCHVGPPTPNTVGAIGQDGRHADFVQVRKEMFAPGHFWDMTQYVFGMGTDGNADFSSTAIIPGTTNMSVCMPGCTIGAGIYGANTWTATRDLAYDNLTCA